MKKAKKEGGELTKKEKKELSEEEKEFKTKRKQIQEKLIKFATRIPVFMYLTDYREQSLKEVITQLEPGLFKRVTGLSVKDFELLVSLGVFRDSVMNDAVYKFRRYEDASLSYTGIEKHSYDARVGLFDTSLTMADFELMAKQDTLLDETGRMVRGTSTVKHVDTSKPGAVTRVREKKESGTARTDDTTQAPVASTASATAPTAAQTTPAKRDWIVNAIEDQGLKFVDLRETSEGNLWVIGGGELDNVMKQLAKRGASFEFTFRGNKATVGNPGWWISGYPEEAEEPAPITPAPTDAQLAALEVGDTVFHKAFGYGEVVDIDREGGFIDVILGVDKHGKPKQRKFKFPNVFDQGLLAL